MESGDQRLIRERENFVVSIRKAARDEVVRQKRIINNSREEVKQEKREVGEVKLEIQQNNSSDQDRPIAEFTPPQESYKRRTYCMRDFDKLSEFVRGENQKKVFEGLYGIRKLLSNPNNNSISRACQDNLYPFFIKYSAQSENQDIKEEALSCLINSTAGTSGIAPVIIRQGGIEMALKVLQQTKVDKRLEAVWLLANLAVDEINVRDSLIEQGFIQFVMKFYIEVKKQKAKKRTLIWILSNICRGYPSTDYQKTKIVLPLFCELIAKTGFDKQNRLTEALWTVSYFCESSKDAIKKIIELNLLPRLTEMLRCPLIGINIPTLRIFNSIYQGNFFLKQLSQIFRYLSIYKTFFELLNHQKKAVRREACVTVSNILLIQPKVAKQIIAQREVLSIITDRAKNDVMQVRKELLYVLYNILYSVGLDAEIIRLCDKYKIMQIFVEAGKSFADKRDIVEVLQMINELFILGQKKREELGVNPLKLFFDNVGGQEVLAAVSSKSQDISLLLAKIEDFYDSQI